MGQQGNFIVQRKWKVFNEWEDVAAGTYEFCKEVAPLYKKGHIKVRIVEVKDTF